MTRITNALSVQQTFAVGLGMAVAILMMTGIVSAKTQDDEHGKTIFQQSCAVCHGVTGVGDGYRHLNPPPADLASPPIQDTSDEVLLRSIREGHSNTAMGAWKLAFSEEEFRDVLAYIRTLREK